jgi:hypothetical protein
MHLCAVKLQDSIPSSPSRNIRHYFYRYVEEKLRAAVRIFVTVPNWLKDRLQNTKRGELKLKQPDKPAA